MLCNVYEKDPRLALEMASEIGGNPLVWFCPNLVQEKAINAITETMKESTIPTILMQCGNGVGKTEIALQILLNVILGAQNGWFDNAWANNYPFPKVAWYVSTKQAIEGRITGGLKELLAGTEYKSYRGYKGYEHKYTFPNGWVLKMFTTSQDASEFESETVGLVVADEPVPEPIWRAIMSRRRAGCMTFLPLTPLDTEPYLDTDIVEHAGEPGIRVIRGTIWDVTEDKERGHLSYQTAREMVAQYSPDERAARERGEFMYYKEIIYPEFGEQHIVSPSDYPYKDNYLLFHVVDPHDGRPPAALWGFVMPNGRHVICNEYPDRYDVPYWEMKGSLNLDEELSIYELIERKIGGKPFDRILDKHFGNQTRGETKKTLFDAYLDRGYYFKQSYTADTQEGEIVYGHRLVASKLASLPDGKPGLLVYNTCHHTIAGLQKYIRRRPKTKLDYEKGTASGKIIEKYKDFPDLVRYFVCHSTRPKNKQTRALRKNPYTSNPIVAI